MLWPDAARPLDGARGIGDQLAQMKTITQQAADASICREQLGEQDQTMTEPTESAPAGEPPRTTERWIYGGLRVVNAGTVHAWLPEPAAGKSLPEELWYRLKTKGHWMVGGIYTATVTRTGQRVQFHGSPGQWLQQFEGRQAVARLEVLDRAARDEIAHNALQRRAAKDPALATAIRPLLEVAAGLRIDAQVRALLAYVTEQIYAARWRRR